MAEINQGTGRSKPNGKVRIKRQSTKIDMTPMVDLAFLLLTFFILTSTFNDHKIMDVAMPEKKVETPIQINENNVLNFVLAENDKVYWWIGLTPPAKVTNFSNSGVRKILLEKKANSKLMVLIKPKDNCKYQNMVDILDELAITSTENYAIVDFTEDDETIISGNLSRTDQPL